MQDVQSKEGQREESGPNPHHHLPACPVSPDRIPLLHHQGEGQAGAGSPQEDMLPAVFTQVNVEDKGALAKLVEAIRTNDDRYDELCHHWGGNILGPKSVTHIAKLGMAKDKELATEQGQMYTPKFSVHKSN
ncbi:60S ribosomal protein L7a [Lemmus lemmus]